MLSKAKSTTSVELDNMSSGIVNSAQGGLAKPPLNLSLSTGYVLEVWKTAIVMSLHKGRPTTYPMNYWPISPCSLIYKAVVLILSDKIWHQKSLTPWITAVYICKGKKIYLLILGIFFQKLAEAVDGGHTVHKACSDLVKDFDIILIHILLPS